MPGQLCDKLKVLHTLIEISVPAVIPDQNEGVVGPDHFSAEFLYLLFMVLPGFVLELGFCFQIRLKMEMQISDGVQAHVSLLHISGINIVQLFPGDFCEPQNTFSLRRRSVRHPVTREKACDDICFFRKKTIAAPKAVPAKGIIRPRIASLILSAQALLNFSFGCLQRGHFQSAGSSSKATPSCSAGS